MFNSVLIASELSPLAQIQIYLYFYTVSKDNYFQEKDNLLKEWRTEWICEWMNEWHRRIEGQGALRPEWWWDHRPASTGGLLTQDSCTWIHPLKGTKGHEKNRNAPSPSIISELSGLFQSPFTSGHKGTAYIYHAFWLSSPNPWYQGCGPAPALPAHPALTFP